jgi:uridine kinase
VRYVVGVAAPAGGGKSTLVRALAEAMADTAVLHIDSYQKITEQPVREIVRWMERGADFDEFEIPQLAGHLEKLKQGLAVADPKTGHEIAPRKYILFETHFGRAHRDSGRFIDFLIWLDTPLDVALARNLMDLIAPLLQAREPAVLRERLASIQRHLAAYLQDVRRLRLLQKERVGAGADLVIDGAESLDTMVERARLEILRRLP